MNYEEAYKMMTERSDENYSQLMDALQKLWKYEDQAGVPRTTYDED